jgi:putative hydrolase of the HAD superfamily
MADHTIEAVLFDFGGVVLTSPFEAFSRYEAEIGVPDGLLRSLNATNPDTNAWAQLERSEVTIEEFCALYEAEAAAVGHTIEGARVLEALAGELRPEMVEAVRRCAARLKTACLTNNFVTTPGHVDREQQMADVMSQFQVVVESSKVGVRKPDPRFYEMACELLDVKPAVCVFLDDLGINLKPAKALGMTTIKVLNAAQAIDDLEAVVGFPLRDSST